MKIYELLAESNDLTTEEDYARDLEDILYAAFANDLTKLSTKSVAKQMIAVGYQTSLNHVAQVAKTIPIVADASVSQIVMGTDFVGDMADDSETEDDAQTSDISNMAQQRAVNNMKD